MLVVIQLGVTGFKKTEFVYLLDLFGGREEKMWYDLMFVEHIFMIGLANIGGFVDAFLYMVSMVLALWGVGVILGNGYAI